MSWSHRPALDGLRTIAVYLVVLYHCGVAAFTGGFVGVDLFFVLSGFLVTSVLLDQLHTRGTIGLKRFYARRVRRLLPAALVVIVATSALFMVLVTLPERLPWVGDARAALLYVANWHFIANGNDYFGPDIASSPFLHFWSLAIEEQFYLVLPVLLLGLFRLRNRWAPAVTTVLATLLVLGIGAQVVWSQVNPTWAYYGTDARIYQLLLGSLAAWLWHSRVQVHLGANMSRGEEPLTAADRGRALTVWAALAALVLVASGWVDLNVSLRGLLAAAAAVVVIWAVTDEWSLSLNWLLSRATITYLGRISYGTYLWHWPVVLAFDTLLDADPWVLAGLVAVVSTALAALSARLLETPIRRPSFLDRASGPTIAAGLTFSIMCAVGFSPWLLEADVKPQVAVSSAAQVSIGADAARVPGGIDWAAFAKDNGEADSACLSGERQECWVVKAADDSAPKVMLIGDSHAQQIAGTLTGIAKREGFSLATSIMARCSWQWGLVSTEKYMNADCVPLREKLYTQTLKDWGIDVVVLAQRERSETAEWHGLVSAEGVSGNVDQVNRVTVAKTLDALDKLGTKVVVVGTQLQSTTAGLDDPLACLASATYAAQCQVPAPESPPVVDSFYVADALAHRNQKVVSLNPVMCREWPVCSPLIGKIPVFRDANHMTAAAIEARRDDIWKLLRSTGFFTRG